MVSYPDTVQDRSAVVVRASSRAPSVASSSRASTSRRHHRHQRSSQPAGSTYQPQNEFPVFTHTGDVEIIITSNPHARRASSGHVGPYANSQAPRREQRYLLHRLILTQASGFFEAGTSEEWSRAQAEVRPPPSSSALARMPAGPAAADDGARKKRWRYELDWGEHGDEMPMLLQKDAAPSPTPPHMEHAPLPPPVHNKPAPPTNGFFRTMANFSSLNIGHHSAPPPANDVDEDIFRDYDNLFRIFYNYPPSLDSVNIAQAYVECKTLLQLADMYDALDVIGPRIDHHLLRFQGRLFKQIAKYPPSYLKLGFLARSRVIYAEAMIHVVGQWPVGATQLRGQVPGSLMEVIEDKADELEELKTKIETKLFKLTLTTSRGERVTPSNSWLDWMAMSLFRQWLAENTSRPPATILKDPSTQRSSRATANPGARSSLSLATFGAAGSGTRGAHAARSGNPRGNGSVVSSTHHSYATSSALSHVSASDAPPSTTFAAPSSNQPLNTGRVFRLIGIGGDAYLTHDELKRFLKLSPELYTRDNMRRFERRVEMVKNLAADAVKPLMRNYLELDLGASGVASVPYLTCTRVEEGDFVWDD
ncbi:hypothetical protein IWX49DRAFT_195779 [Phyllosticta citricarpa]|uniref:Uncharacterized protein n=1 Tax=Phyllosticta paracitricarpa TaxID=2016321 RepID=A0ABR1MZP4_9PEZI